MNEKNYYPIAAAIIGLVAIGQIVVSKTFHTVWGIDANDTTIFMSNRWGWMTLATAFVIWQARNHPGFYQTINLALGVAAVAQSIYVVLGMLNGMLSGLGWGSAALEFGLGVGFLYLYLRGRGQSQTA